tara:strand:- start:91895 stop:92095 length:201 start_codon:yes stop_codon:yes gene_type:complete
MRSAVKRLAESADVIFVADVVEVGSDFVMFEDIVYIKGVAPDPLMLSYVTPNEYVLGARERLLLRI